jgi:hypothetical protein
MDKSETGLPFAVIKHKTVKPQSGNIMFFLIIFQCRVTDHRPPET